VKLVEQKIISPVWEHLNKHHQKSICKHLLIIAIYEDELELTLVETGESKEHYQILGEVKALVGTEQILNQMILDEIIEYISQTHRYKTSIIKSVVENYELIEDISEIKNEKIKKYLLKLKHDVGAIKYILSHFKEMSLEVLEQEENLVIDQTYFEEEILEKLELKSVIKSSISNLIKKMNNQYTKWAIDEILLVGRMVQIPYIKQVIEKELISRGISKSRIFEVTDKEYIHTVIKDLFYLSHRIEEQVNSDQLPKIEYQGRIYEYVKKEFNNRSHKEEITLRYGKAEERYAAEKERYFKFLPAEIQEKEVLDFQIAILDESNQYKELMDLVFIKKLIQLEGVEEGEKFLTYYVDIEDLLRKIKQDKKVQYVLIVANESQYKLCAMRLHETVNDIRILHISILENEKEILLEDDRISGRNQLEEVKEQALQIPERIVMAEYEVMFNGGYYAYFTDYYQVDRLDKRKSIVEEKYIKQIKIGDQLIFVDDHSTYGKNIMMYILESTINSNQTPLWLKEDYRLFIQWKEELQIYIDHHGYDTEHIAVLLEQYGVSLTKQAIDQWLPDGRTIAPQMPKSLIALIDIIGSQSLKNRKGKAYEASKNIRKLHVHIKQLIEEIIFRESSMKHCYYTGIERIAYEKVREFKSYSKILDVKSIKRIRKKIKVSQVNKILKE